MGQSVFPSRDLFQRRKGQEVEHLPEGKGDHGKIDTPLPDGQGADKAGKKHGEKKYLKKDRSRCCLPVAKGQSGAVSPHSKVGRVPEGEDPRVSQEEVEAESEDPPDQDLGGQGRGNNKRKNKETRPRPPHEGGSRAWALPP